MYSEMLIHYSTHILMDSTADIGKKKLPIENINERHL